MGKAWLVRPKVGQDVFLNWFRKNGLIAFDIPYMDSEGRSFEARLSSEPNFEGKTPEDIHRLLTQSPYNFDSNEAGAWKPQINYFLNEMSTYDLVLLPSDSTIFLASITGPGKDRRSRDKCPTDCDEMRYQPKYQRSVKWLASTSRNKLSNELRKALKLPRSIGDLSKFYEEIDALSRGQQYTPKADTRVVSYWLRPDFEITYTIPVDMTDVEAERLSVAFRNTYFQQAQNEETPEQ